MKKKLMLALAMVIGLNAVLPAFASVESMYNDLKALIEDPVSGKSLHQRLDNVQDILRKAFRKKESLSNKIVRANIETDAQDTIEKNSFGIACASLALFAGYTASTGWLIPANEWKYNEPPEQFAVVAVICGAVAVFILGYDSAVHFCNKRKLAEINKLIIKLQAMEKDLQEEIAKMHQHFFKQQVAVEKRFF